jgi:hypothetical protein
MLLLGPSVLLPKSIFAVRLPPIGEAFLQEGREENDMAGQRQKKLWDAIERGVLRGLIGRSEKTEPIGTRRYFLVKSSCLPLVGGLG